ncbi:MAG: hypothetical protein V4603_17765 [Pseudomonadota bacterium]
MKTRILLLLALLSVPVMAAEADISGDWIIDSSVGGATPIKVHCTLVQAAGKLSGTCTPEMENAEASKLTGTVSGNTAEWSYDVVFRDQPGHIAFTADSVSNDKISGKLSLSGTEAPFTATRGK